MKRKLAKFFAFCQEIDVDQRSEDNVPDYVMTDSALAES